MIAFREATGAKKTDKENILETQRKDSLAQNSTSMGGFNGRKRPDLYGHRRGMTSMCGEKTFHAP